ncbi:MAG: tetratricopeptide repeat protein [Myxococcales bacterium]|nr:tetratricopeptide repeat protein [Myxococcales bacterium]
MATLRWAGRFAHWVIAGSTLSAGCAQQKAGEGPPPEAGTSAAQVAPPAPTREPAGQAPPDEDFRPAMRVGDWVLAARILDRSPETVRKTPAARFARAHAAAQLGEYRVCVERLDGLEAELPVLASEIAEARAHCQLEVGPFEAAAKYFGQKDTSRDLIRAATAFERAKQPEKAKAMVAQVIVREIKRRAHSHGRRKASRVRASLRREADAREIRARIYDLEQKPKLAEADRHWIATQVPAQAPPSGDTSRQLNKQQRYERAMEFARDGDIAHTDAELELLASSPGGAIPEKELVHARGWARYMARHYKDAAPLLEQASALGSQHAIRDYYYAAKAWSRADEDQRAIEMYERLMVRYSSSSYADHARYMAARLRYILGDWKGAEKAYKGYLAKYPRKGQHSSEARYELAITWLAGEKPADAQRVLAELEKEEKDPRDKARLVELLGVALAAQGKQPDAVKRFREVIEERPLSFAALMATARLKQLGQSPPPPIAPPESSKSPGPLALSLPPKVKALHDSGLSLRAESELERVESSFKKSFADRADEALCRTYAMLGSAARRYRVGQRAVRWADLNTAPSAANRWAWECIYPEPFVEAVENEARKNSLPRGLVYALMRQESGFRPHVVSPAKAVGLMQLIPPTARNVATELSVDYRPELLRLPAYNIRFGSYYLKKVLDQFSGSVPLALAAYNAGPNAVGRWLKTGHKLPLDVFVARIPYGETRGYVARVVGNLARYAYLEGGEAAVPELPLQLPSDVQVPDDAY